MKEHTGPAVDERTVRAAIELASRAPSVHNSQSLTITASRTWSQVPSAVQIRRRSWAVLQGP